MRGCGLTAVRHAGLPFFITHVTGAMLVTDLRNETLEHESETA
jgi:uncharacterized protein YcsI (UPF0317 family)